MKMSFLFNKLALGMVGLLWCCVAEAGTPLWTFTPLTATTLTIASGATAIVQYTVTNQSKKVHTLEMNPIVGITQVTSSLMNSRMGLGQAAPSNICSSSFTLGYQQSCTLSLIVNGSTLQNNVVGGPVVCQKGNQLQCYQPGKADALNITRIVQPEVAMITGGPAGDPPFLTGTNMNWLGDSPSAYKIFYCSSLGCDINQFSSTPGSSITAISMEIDGSVSASNRIAICPSAEPSYNAATCSNIYEPV